MIKYLRRENLSSKNYEVKLAAHPGSITEDLIGYVKPVVRKQKTDFLVIHTGTNDLTNGVKAMKEIRNIAKCVRDLDKDKKVNIGFLSVISRSDRNLGQEIRDLNLKLKRYCEGNTSYLLTMLILKNLVWIIVNSIWTIKEQIFYAKTSKILYTIIEVQGASVKLITLIWAWLRILVRFCLT